MKKLLKVFSFILSIVIYSCANEPIDSININNDLVDEDLYNLITQVSDDNGENAINCIEFNYSFALFVFDENEDFIEAVSMHSNEQFSLFLANLNPTYSISVNYPISGTLLNGDLVEINNNVELKEAIDNCTADEFKRKCDNTLKDCIWKISPLIGYPNSYEGNYYYLNQNGTVQFHVDNKVYFGTWITLYIGTELFLNIDLNDNAGIEADWDHNWLINYLSDTEMQLDNGSTIVRILKDCTIPCDLTTYQECENPVGSGISQFNLQSRIHCTGVPPNHDITSALVYTYYETEIDAMNGINPVSPLDYTNIENPQLLYVRIEYISTGEVLGFLDITIEAISC